MNKYTVILWDVDNTLLDFQFSQQEALRICFQSIGREMTEEILNRYDEINDSFWKKLELGLVTKAQLLPGRFIQLFEEFDIRDVDVESFRRRYQQELGTVYAYKDDSINICKSLSGKVKQYVVTNGVSSTQRNKLKLAGFADVMDGIFVSEEIGTPKPKREFFDYCLAHIEEQDKRRILLVGDSLSSDIRGGCEAGIPTCWYRPEGTINPTDYRPDYEINHLQQIFEIIK